MGSKEGIEKMRGRLIEQYGSVERYLEFRRANASKGGKAPRKKYNFMDIKIASKAGKKSKRGKVKDVIVQEITRLKIQDADRT